MNLLCCSIQGMKPYNIYREMIKPAIMYLRLAWSGTSADVLTQAK